MTSSPVGSVRRSNQAALPPPPSEVSNWTRDTHRVDGYEVLAKVSASIAVPAVFTGLCVMAAGFFAPEHAANAGAGLQLLLWGGGATAAGVAGCLVSKACADRSSTIGRR